MEIIQYPNYILKFIIIGSSQVGKTSLIRRFTDNIYEDTLRTTIGVDFKFKCINMLDNKTARIQIWDTAGQERFKSITNKYYNDVHGTIICFDISQSTRRLIKWTLHKLYYWLYFYKFYN